MPSELISVTLKRETVNEVWGFELRGGLNEPLVISEVKPRSFAEALLRVEDIIIRINNREAAHLSLPEAVELICDESEVLNLTIERACGNRKISTEKAAGTFSLFVGATGTEVVQESDSFFSNREELERTTTAGIKLNPDSNQTSYIKSVLNTVDQTLEGPRTRLEDDPEEPVELAPPSFEIITQQQNSLPLQLIEEQEEQLNDITIKPETVYPIAQETHPEPTIIQEAAQSPSEPKPEPAKPALKVRAEATVSNSIVAAETSTLPEGQQPAEQVDIISSVPRKPLVAQVETTIQHSEASPFQARISEAVIQSVVSKQLVPKFQATVEETDLTPSNASQVTLSLSPRLDKIQTHVVIDNKTSDTVMDEPEQIIVNQFEDVALDSPKEPDEMPSTPDITITEAPPIDTLEIDAEPEQTISIPSPVMKAKRKKRSLKIKVKTEPPTRTEDGPKQVPMARPAKSFEFLERESKPLKLFRPKPNRLKDWNCPWVRTDGSGLKNTVKSYFAEPVVAPVATSHQHFYSEPHSILEEPLSDAEIREMQRKFYEEEARKAKEEHERQVRMEEERKARMAEEERRLQLEKEQRAAKSEKEKKVRFSDGDIKTDDLDLEALNHQVNNEFKKSDAVKIIQEELGENKELMENLTSAINVEMDGDDSDQPTAEELIDVLKNLENLAARNPALYKAIVNEIKGGNERDNDLEQNVYQINENDDEDADYDETPMNGIQDTPEEEETNNDHVDRAPTPPPSPVQTSRSNPIPEVEPDPFLKHQPQQEHPRPNLQTGGQTRDSNGQVPMAAQSHSARGLYPRPMPDYDYPWAGSLRPVSHEIFAGKNLSRREDPGACPWAGSLRHVREPNEGTKRGRSNDFESRNGTPPWMGSLRHVQNPSSRVSREQQRWQSRRYPEEDAPNPFQKARVRSEVGVPQSTLDSIDKDVAKLKNTLKEKKNISGELLSVLMPKLLQIHESKYEAMDESESLQIMEEILGMRSQTFDNQAEAEQMIRAIQFGEIDNSVYSQMADDLEQAAQLKRQEKEGQNMPNTPPPTPQVSSSPPFGKMRLNTEIEEDEF